MYDAMGCKPHHLSMQRALSMTMTSWYMVEIALTATPNCPIFFLNWQKPVDALQIAALYVLISQLSPGTPPEPAECIGFLYNTSLITWPQANVVLNRSHEGWVPPTSVAGVDHVLCLNEGRVQRTQTCGHMNKLIKGPDTCPQSGNRAGLGRCYLSSQVLLNSAYCFHGNTTVIPWLPADSDTHNDITHHYWILQICYRWTACIKFSLAISFFSSSSCLQVCQPDMLAY